jgi:hypothetical protein
MNEIKRAGEDVAAFTMRRIRNEIEDPDNKSDETYNLAIQHVVDAILGMRTWSW